MTTMDGPYNYPPMQMSCHVYATAAASAARFLSTKGGEDVARFVRLKQENFSQRAKTVYGERVKRHELDNQTTASESECGRTFWD
jgi:hypothetical protein